MRKKALITGASRGIGAAAARALAQDGYDLFLVCKSSKEALERVRQELTQQYGICCETALCDVSNAREVETMIKNAGEIHVLVNNAAVSYVGLLICRLVVPQMVHRKEGKILNISSVWGKAGASMEVAYSASKGGVNSFTKALARELSPSNIQVNGIAFGVIDTEMNACFSAEELRLLEEEIPAGRMGSVREAGELIRLIIGAPAYLTGQILTMDGGWIG